MSKRSVTVITLSLVLLLALALAFLAFVWLEGSDEGGCFTSAEHHISNRVDLPHNSPKTIREELLDDTLVWNIGKAAGVSDECLSAMRRTQGESWSQNRPWDWFDWPHEHWNEGNKLRHALREYVEARYEGHTKEFMRITLTNAAQLAEIEDPGIRGIVEVYPWVPASMLRKVASGIDTNQRYTVSPSGELTEIIPNEPRKYAVYSLVDGDVAWRYYVEFNDDGSARTGADKENNYYRGYIQNMKHDAKEEDEKYAKIFRNVETGVEIKMKIMGITGLGSCHSFWAYKKKSLAKRGILWRSPSELNPDAIYD